MRHLATFTVFVLCALAAQAFAGDSRLGDLVVSEPWARATIGQAKAGAAYFTVANNGAAADRLVAVESPAAKRSELHGHTMDGGVMRMRPVEAIELAPGAPVVLQPGGLHVMLMGLKAPLKQGGRFPLTLIFEKSGRLEVEVRVEGATAMGPAS